MRIYYRILLVAFLSTFFTCSNEKLNLKNGTFKTFYKDSAMTIIERNDKFQMEYRVINQEVKELFRIKWNSNIEYELTNLTGVKPKDSIDDLPVVTHIDSIFNNTYYHTTSSIGYDFIYSGKIIKIKNGVSNDFVEMIKNLQ